MAEIGKLSATKIGTYITCPFLYYLKYIEHEKVPTSVNLVFGRQIHYMLEQFYKVSYKDADKFANSWKYRWRGVIAGEFLKGKEKENLKIETHTIKLRGGGEDKIETGNHVKFFGETPVSGFYAYKRLGVSILKRFYERHKPQPSPSLTEKRFTFNFRGYEITGVLDRVERYNGGIYITDYKTDKSSPERGTFILHKHPQFTIYSSAYRSLFNEEEKNILYYHLRSGTVLKTTRVQADYDYLEQLCERVSDGISKDDFTPHYGYQCRFCDFQRPCSQRTTGLDGIRMLEKDEIKAEYPEEWMGWLMDDER